MMATMLNTVDEVITALGGPRQVAQLVNVGPSAISNAKKAEHIPHPWRLAIYREAERRGLVIAPDLIGLPSEGAAA